MITEQFRAFLKAQPFQPFKIRTMNGEAFHISRPHSASISYTGQNNVVLTGDDSFRILDASVISEVEIIPDDPLGLTHLLHPTNG